MPGRRPYASRGVPRRATTRRSGASVAGIAALASVLALIGALTVWVTNPLASDWARVASPTGSTSGSAAAVDGNASSALGVLQMANVATPVGTPEPKDPTAPGAAAGPTPLPTLRRWDPGSDLVLAGRLDQALLGVDGHVGVAVKDLGSGRWALLNGDLELQSASLYKLPILYTAYASGLSMNEDLPITDEALSYDAGTMELGPGETLTVAEALERMVTLSDNTSAIMLGTRVGANRINASIANLGMETTHYSLERMTTSAQDMLRLIESIAEGDAVSSAASADMVHLLLRQRVNDRLPRLLPDDVQVAHKTGNLPGTVNDVGVLYGPSSTIAVVALVSDTSDEAAAATAIARVALAAYSYFDEQPEAIDRPLIPPMPARAIPPVRREPRPVPPTPTPTEEVIPTPEAQATPTAVAPRVLPVVAATATAVPQVAPTAVPTAKPTAPPPPTATPPPPPTATPVPVVPTRAPTRAPTAVPPGKR